MQEDVKLFRSKEFKGRTVAGVDEEVGKVVDVLFDDERWTVRYLVVDTGSWFSSRQVLISPASLAAEQPDDATVKTLLTREQITNSPPLDTHLPVSRQYESEHATYYGHPVYWMGSGLWGGAGMPLSPEWVTPPRGADAGSRTKAARQRGNQESHLHSSGEVTGYHIEALDGDIGHLDEFLIDSQSWQILRLVIDTRNWLPGKFVQVDPAQIRRVDWPDRKVHVELTQAQIKALPEVAG